MVDKSKEGKLEPLAFLYKKRTFFLYFYTFHSLYSILFFFFCPSLHVKDKKKMTATTTFKEEVSPGRVLTMDADGTGLSVIDPWLKPFDDALRER